MKISIAKLFRAHNRQTQRGSGDTGTLMTVMVICGLLSASLIVLNWVKSVKEERLEHRYDASRPVQGHVVQDQSYQVTY